MPDPPWKMAKLGTVGKARASKPEDAKYMQQYRAARVARAETDSSEHEKLQLERARATQRSLEHQRRYRLQFAQERAHLLRESQEEVKALATEVADIVALMSSVSTDDDALADGFVESVLDDAAFNMEVVESKTYEAEVALYAAAEEVSFSASTSHCHQLGRMVSTDDTRILSLYAEARQAAIRHAIRHANRHATRHAI